MRKGSSIENAEVTELNEIVLNDQTNVIQEKKSKKINKADKIRLLLLVITILVAVTVTTLLIVFRINESNKSQNDLVIDDEEIVKKPEISEVKGLEYVVKDFKQMYYTNPITVKEKKYVNGNIEANYIEISGLKDKTVQNKINDEIKNIVLNEAIDYGVKGESSVNTFVETNFNNIFGVCIYVYLPDDYLGEGKRKEIYLNYNLATGEKIYLFDLFTTNAPLNLMLSHAIYEAFAWQELYNENEKNPDRFDFSFDMNNADTAKYEDRMLKAIRNFKMIAEKDISFSIRPNYLYIFNDLGISDDNYQYVLNINLFDYYEYVTMYNKFLTNKDIYETLPKASTIVYTNNFRNELSDDDINIEYGFKQDNVFVDVIKYTYYDDEISEELKKKADKLMISKYNEAISTLKMQNTNGYIFRGIVNVDVEYEKELKESFIRFSADYSAFQMTKEYFDSDGMKLLILSDLAPKVAIDSIFLNDLTAYDKKNVKKINTDKISIHGYYYDINGKLIAKSDDDFEDYIANRIYEKQLEENRTEVNVYSE